MIENFSEIALLLDFYGNLLTEKQRMILSYYYEEDMSLGEISDEFNITRQAVHDIIKRSSKILKDYESKLKLVSRFTIQKEKLLEIKKHITDISNKDEIERIVNLIDEIINM